jgi:hypothetical protein
MRKVAVVFFGLLCLVFVLTQAAVAQEKAINSDKFSLEDAKAYVNKIVKARSLAQGYTLDAEIVGIRNQEGEATIYYVVTRKDNLHFRDRRSIEIVRLDSGQWFDPKSFEFVTK